MHLVETTLRKLLVSLLFRIYRAIKLHFVEKIVNRNKIGYLKYTEVPKVCYAPHTA
jgi:hypothetical protein